MTEDTHMDEIVVRQAPRWAWDLIDETLALDASSSSFDGELRADIRNALNAMIHASEECELQRLSVAEVTELYDDE